MTLDAHALFHLLPMGRTICAEGLKGRSVRATRGDSKGGRLGRVGEHGRRVSEHKSQMLVQVMMCCQWVRLTWEEGLKGRSVRATSGARHCPQ